MNRRDAMKAMAAAAVLPAVPVLAKAVEAERPVRLFWFGGSGDTETIAAHSQEEAEAYMRSLVGKDYDAMYAGKVEEVPREEWGDHQVACEDDDGNSWSWSYRQQLDHNLHTVGCPVPHYFSSMNV